MEGGFTVRLPVYIWPMFDELADGVFRRHYEFLRLNIGVVIGEDGVLIIDSRESHEAGAELAADIRTLTTMPVRWIVNTHWHWDHVFGNAMFPDATIWGHRICHERLSEDSEAGKMDARRWMPEDRWDEIDRVVLVAPTETFEAMASIDTGVGIVRMSFHGRGHTDNDVVIQVDDVTFMGDLVEHGGAPNMGDGYLLDWPATLFAIEPTAGVVVVPGHGDVGTREWLVAQRADMEEAAERLRDVLYTGRSLDDAARGGPFPEADMREGLKRGLAWASEG